MSKQELNYNVNYQDEIEPMRKIAEERTCEAKLQMDKAILDSFQAQKYHEDLENMVRVAMSELEQIEDLRKHISLKKCMLKSDMTKAIDEYYKFYYLQRGFLDYISSREIPDRPTEETETETWTETETETSESEYEPGSDC
jgi:hypothetical protein